ncbi:MAG: 16S rRNA (adenine(1518)-N(6)/adenine(1519)-N(6))-dimethyltransferase RsmA [Acidobacteria bacterium]|nr:16S rRNA (adenine(1518)-N(6)/adenine(1519)-N(6))-dimethyltransferase RsmA [Acidobacteriota bacterium]
MPMARRRFGQHFLEPAWIDKVLAAAGLLPGDHVIEIGPGRGALTRPLAERVASVTAIELDRDLVAWLRPRVARNVTVVSGDVLTLGREALFSGLGPDQPVRVIGNLPYNVSSPILFRLLDLHRETGRLIDASLMLQREVADRVSAAPGSRETGVLSIMVQLDADVDTVLTLPPGAFRPVPKVRSAVVRLRFRAPSVPLSADSRRLFEALVRSIFAQRRKTLANALRPLAASMAVDPKAVLVSAGIDASRRPETLHLVDLAALVDALAPLPRSSVL